MGAWAPLHPQWQHWGAPDPSLGWADWSVGATVVAGYGADLMGAGVDTEELAILWI